MHLKSSRYCRSYQLAEPVTAGDSNPVSETSNTVTTTGSEMSQLESQLNEVLSKQLKERKKNKPPE